MNDKGNTDRYHIVTIFILREQHITATDGIDGIMINLSDCLMLTGRIIQGTLSN